MASGGLLFPRSFHPFIFNAAAGVSLVPIVAGAYGLLNPGAGFQLLYFPPPPPPPAASNAHARDDPRRLAHGLFRMYAVRQVSLGLSTLVMWATGSRRALGWSMLGGCVVALADALVAREVAGEHVAGHWVGVGLSLLFSGSMLGVL